MGLDNWLYSAKSNRRLRLVEGRLVEEPTLFRGQWGITQDDEGQLYYNTNSVTMGGGMSADVILDTTGLPTGDYYLYAADLQYLANYDEPEPTGGIMTKIVIQ